MKISKFFVFALIVPVVCFLLLRWFHFVAFADFPGRDVLYHFLGFVFLPVYPAAGLIACILFIVVSIIKKKSRQLNWLQVLIIAALNIFVWLYISGSYIMMA